MKLMDGYSPVVIGVVLLVVVLAFGLWYTRPTEGFATGRVMEGFNQEQKNAACKSISDQIQTYNAELQKPANTDEMKKIHDQIRDSIKQMETVKQQYGC